MCTRSPHGRIIVLNGGVVVCVLMAISRAWAEDGLNLQEDSSWVPITFGVLYFLDCVFCKTFRFLLSINWLEDVFQYVMKHVENACVTMKSSNQVRHEDQTSEPVAQIRYVCKYVGGLTASIISRPYLSSQYLLLQVWNATIGRSAKSKKHTQTQMETHKHENEQNAGRCFSIWSKFAALFLTPLLYVQVVTYTDSENWQLALLLLAFPFTFTHIRYYVDWEDNSGELTEEIKRYNITKIDYHKVN